jgi:hypothetical protein
MQEHNKNTVIPKNFKIKKVCIVPYHILGSENGDKKLA